MALVSSVDYVARKIYLGIASVGVTLDALDIYREVVELRRLDTQVPYPHRSFQPMIVQGGNIQKTSTAYTSPYVQLLYGCEIIPYDALQTLTLVRDTFSDDGRAGAACFNTAGFSHVVNFIEAVEKVEVREVLTGGSVAPTVQEIRIEMDTNSTKLDVAVGTRLAADDYNEYDDTILHNLLIEVRKLTGNKVVLNGTIATIYEDDGTTIWKQYDFVNDGRIEL